jgi:hypothetical protein
MKKEMLYEKRGAARKRVAVRKIAARCAQHAKRPATPAPADKGRRRAYQLQARRSFVQPDEQTIDAQNPFTVLLAVNQQGPQ